MIDCCCAAGSGRVHELSPTAPLAMSGPTTAAATAMVAPIEPARTPRINVRFTTIAFRALANSLGSAVLGGTPRAQGTLTPDQGVPGAVATTASWPGI